MEVDAEGAVHGLDGHVEKCMERADAGVGDHHVDTPERLDGACNEIGRGLGQRDIAFHREAALAQRLDLGDAARGLVVG